MQGKPAQDPRITILAYDRVVDRPDGINVDQALFVEHLLSLQKRGFVPITLEKLRSFYDRGEILPPRPLLLTFNSGYLKTYSLVDPILRKMNWTAVIFIDTVRQGNRNQLFLYWDRLQRMVDSGVWEVGIHSYNGTDSVSNKNGEMMAFVSNMMLSKEKDRMQSGGELGPRILHNSREGKKLLDLHLRGTETAFSFLPGTLEAIAREQDVDLYLKELKALYRFCFRDDHFTGNDRFSGDYCLTRFRITNLWSGKTMVQRLESALENPILEGDTTDKKSLQFEGEHVVNPERSYFIIEGTTRAEFWIPGSQWIKDWVMEGDFRFPRGVFWITQEFKVVGKQWRWGGDDQGVAMQYKGGQEAFKPVLYSPIQIDRDTWYHIRIVKRGLGVWVEWEGAPVWERPLYLPNPEIGPVGIVIWNKIGKATLHYSNLKFFQYPYQARLVSPWPDTKEVQSLIRNAPAVAAISPLAVVINEQGIEKISINDTLFHTLSHRFGWEIVPAIRLLEGGELTLVSESNAGQGDYSEHLSSKKILARIEEEQWMGVHFDLATLSQRGLQSSIAPLQAIQRIMEAKGKRFVVTPADAARLINDGEDHDGR